MPPLSNEEIFSKIKKLFDDKFVERDNEINILEKKLTEKFKEQFDSLHEQIRALTEANKSLLEANASLEQENQILRKNTDFPTTSNSPTTSTSPPAVPAQAVPADDISILNAEQPASGKKHCDVLILSDSIYRHVGSSCPKVKNTIKGRARPDLQQTCILPIRSHFSIGATTVMKVIMPGARAGALQLQATILASEYDFGEVIVNCGANYVPSVRRPGRRFHMVSPPEAINEITGLINALGNLFTGMITYSMTLPQVNCLDYIENINGINDAVVRYCTSNGLSYLRCGAFERNEDDVVDRQLFAADGIHLGKKGIEAVFNTLDDHLRIDFKYKLSV